MRMNDKICFVGASGFVGTRLIELLKNDFTIKNIDKNPSHFFQELTEIGDVRHQEDLDAGLVGIDTVVALGITAVLVTALGAGWPCSDFSLL